MNALSQENVWIEPSSNMGDLEPYGADVAPRQTQKTDAQFFTSTDDLLLESGQKLQGFQLAYHTFGTLAADGQNVVWVFHALTGNSDVLDWWPGLMGPNKFLDTNTQFIVCANVLGSPYGSTSPLSKNPSNDKNYYQDFPKLTPRDVCQAFDKLRVHLGLNNIALCVGPSLGGQLATEWAVHLGDKLKNLVLIATNAVQSPWGVAFNEAQRMAITADKSWRKRRPDAGLFGMKAARAMAMLSYRHYQTYALTQAPDDNAASTAVPKAASYQQYQGEKLVQRFNAFSYWVLSHMMDAHDVGRGRGGVVEALGQISARTLVVGIESDVLFPPMEQKFLAQHIPSATYAELKSQHGHDGFLVDEPALLEILEAWG